MISLRKLAIGLLVNQGPKCELLRRTMTQLGQAGQSSKPKGSESGYESDSSSSDSLSDSEFSSSSDLEFDEDKKLYSTHIPTSSIQKTLLTIGSALAAITDPYRDDMIAVMGETTGHQALEKVARQMARIEEGRQILVEQPTINSATINYEDLLNLPVNTFGYYYANFMQENNITADSRKPVKFVDDPELAYVMRRYRETHDLVHAILGQPTNMLGEVTVKWIEAIQTDLPMCWSGAIFGAVRLAPKQRRNYVNFNLPWALKTGHDAKLLMGVYFENRFEQDLQELRRELNIPNPPLIK